LRSIFVVKRALQSLSFFHREAFFFSDFYRKKFKSFFFKRLFTFTFAHNVRMPVFAVRALSSKKKNKFISFRYKLKRTFSLWKINFFSTNSKLLLSYKKPRLFLGGQVRRTRTCYKNLNRVFFFNRLLLSRRFRLNSYFFIKRNLGFCKQAALLRVFHTNKALRTKVYAFVKKYNSYFQSRFFIKKRSEFVLKSVIRVLKKKNLAWFKFNFIFIIRFLRSVFIFLRSKKRPISKCYKKKKRIGLKKKKIQKFKRLLTRGLFSFYRRRHKLLRYKNFFFRFNKLIGYSASLSKFKIKAYTKKK
jgi:hypothetical protein